MRKSNGNLPFVYEGAEEWDSEVDKTVEVVLEPHKNVKSEGTKIKYKDTFFVFKRTGVGREVNPLVDELHR